MFRRCILLACFAGLSSQAQEPQFLPEVDTFLTLNPHVRTYLQAKDDREGGDSTQFTFGPSVEFYLKPLLKLKDVTLFDLNDAESRPLVLESGYRIITAPDTPDQSRMIEAVTTHLPLVLKMLAADRNRVDLDWKAGKFTWRYRNRLTLQRAFPVGSYHFIPYLAAEPFYESQYSKWSTTDLYVGSQFPVGKHVQFNVYYEHENDTGKKPNTQQNYFGLILSVYFSREHPARP